MKRIRVLRHSNQARNIKKRPATHSDASRKTVPPRSPRNIRRGHLIVGMRDMNHIEWEAWEKDVADMQRVGAMQVFRNNNRFYDALSDSQKMVREVQQREEELQATNEEMEATNEELQATNEELQVTSEELEREGAYRRILTDSMVDILFTTDRQGMITEINQAAERISGYPQEALVGKAFEGFFTDADRARAAIETVLKGEMVRDYELMLVTKEGREVPLDFNVTPLRISGRRIVGVVGTARDMTEIAKVQEELRLAASYNRSLIEVSPDPMVTISIDGKITDLNQETEKITGRARPELLGTDFSDYFVDPEKAGAGYAKAFREGSVREYPLEIRHLDGRVIPVSYNAGVYRNEAGDIMGVLAAARDVTTAKRNEAELNQVMDALTRSNAELEQFAYIASHDLQEPLRMISSYVGLLQRRYRDKLGDDALEFIAFAVDGAERMQSLINGLLSYSRVGTRQKPFAPTDLEVVFQEAVDNLKLAIEESGAAITHDPLPEIMGDETQLVQLLQNLIGNALKFRGKKPPLIHVSSERVENSAIRNPQSAIQKGWRLSVKDNGIGMDPRFSDRIFKIFQRLNTREEYPGSGMGLAICNKIVERHGGVIWVESRPGEGASFFVDFGAEEGKLNTEH